MGQGITTASTLTIGLDVGDRQTVGRVLSGCGAVVETSQTSECTNLQERSQRVRMEAWSGARAN
jgi:hypothetical protein